MQQNLICIGNRIINLNNIIDIQLHGKNNQIEFDSIDQKRIYIKSDDAASAFQYIKSKCIAVFDDSDETPPQAEDFIDPNWTQHTVTAIEHKKSGSGNPTWYCSLKEHDKTLYIRQSNKDQWVDHYPQLEDMELGDVAEEVNITIYTMPDDNPDFLKTMKVMPDGVLTLQTLSASAQRKAEVAAELQGHETWTWVDFESTGLEDDDEIMQAGLIYESDEGQTVNKRDFLVKPLDAQKVYRVGKNGKSAYNIHGISPEKVADAPTFPEHYQMLKDAIHGKTLASYSQYDLNLLNRVCAMHNLDPIVPAFHIDLIKLFAKYIGEPGFKAGDYKWQTLENAYEIIMGKPLDGAHVAINDAEAMRQIAQEILNKSLEDTPF